MRLKELQIFGFKSFPNKTTIKFSDGITAIIGPNGCGKTNILDALRWVLGEQSFSILRCNKNEELIFAGTAKHPPLGYTEVKLILENNDDLPDFGSEIEIKRKYFRSGESEFYINRNPCRLKDIQDIFFNSGTGSKAYSIFDLKQMREIIAGGTKKMFEEAANLARYRERKNETLNKLALTESELLRFNDVIAERERYTRSLRRQARRLEVYERLRDEEKKLRMVSLKTQYLNAQKSEVEVTASLKEATAKEEAVLLEIAQAEDELEMIRQQLRETRKVRENLTLELGAKQQALQEQEKSLIAKKERISYLKQRIEQLAEETKNAVAKIAAGKQAIENLAKTIREKEQIQANVYTHLENIRSEIRQEEEILFKTQVEFEQAKINLQTITEKAATLHQKEIEATAQYQNLLEAQTRLKTEIENLTSRLDTLKSAITQSENRITAIDQQLAEMKKVQNENNLARENANNVLAQLQERRQSVQESISLLKQEINSLQVASGQKQKAITQEKLGEDFLGTVSEFLMVKDGYELAVEACLYTLLDFLVVKNRIEPNDFKTETRLGFILSTPRCGDFPKDDLVKSKLINFSGVLGQLKEFVEIKPNTPPQILRVLDDFILVENFATAWELSKQYSQLSFVTKDGIALFSSGLIVIEGKGAQGKLTLEKKLKEKIEIKTELEKELAKIIDQIKVREAAIAMLNQKFEHRQDEILNLLSERSKLLANLTFTQNSIEEIKKELSWLEGDFNQTQTRLVTEDGRRNEIKKELADLGSLAQSAKALISQLEQAISERQKTIKEKLEMAGKILTDFGKDNEELSALKTTFDYKTNDVAIGEKRVAEFAKTQESLSAEMKNLIKEVTMLEQEIETNKTTIKLSQQTIQDLTIDTKTLEEERIENFLKEKRIELEAIRASVMNERMKKFEIQKQREAIERESQEFYATDIATVEIIPDEQISNRLKIISERLLSLGKVNPLAKEEFQREKTELDKYLAQRQDVLLARDNLQKTINEIESHTKEQFLQTFGLVRERFRQIFTQLFIEGEADLTLTSETNPLESEIEIIARPKGKMPRRLEHLSDGEKALLALSLLFAFYSVKPAPFCFFDEVDAPLDDVNVGRFANFLRELARSGTQAVVITHNRMTIEKADVLLGVTTEEPGVSKVISVRLADFKKSNEITDRQGLTPRY